MDEELDNDIRELAKTNAGRSVLRWILGLCQIYSDNFTGDNSGFYYQGQRSIGLQILEKLNDVDPRIYIKLITEVIEEIP